MFEILPNDQDVVKEPVEVCKGAEETESATKTWKCYIPLLGALIALVLAVIGGMVSASANYGALADYKQTSIRWNTKQDVRLDNIDTKEKYNSEAIVRIETKVDSNGKILNHIWDRMK
jgi:hypothetical protein